MAERQLKDSICSSIEIFAQPEKVWDNITDVKIEQFSDPLMFKLLNIPKPLRAEIISDGVGGSRIAYFDTGKRFLQKIIVWKPFTEYSFSFNPEEGFRVGYFFELSKGIFRILEGTYNIEIKDKSVRLKLSTIYSIDSRVVIVFKLPVILILKIFQRYLLKSIKRNSE